jgi:hypothetical protein
VLRPGGVFIWSATPVYKTSDEDRQIWTGTSGLIVFEPLLLGVKIRLRCSFYVSGVVIDRSFVF